MKRRFYPCMALLMIVVMLSSCSMPSISELKPAKTKEETKNVIVNVPSLPALTKEPETTALQTAEAGTVVADETNTPESLHSPVGYWLLVYYKSASEEMDEETIKSYSEYFSAPAFIVLEEGGTGFLGFFGEDNEITWTEDKIGDTVYSFDENQLIVGGDSEEVLFKFIKSDAKAPKRGEYARVEPTTAAPDFSEAQITETVLLDEKGVKITAKSISYSGWFGPEVKLLIENNSGKDLRFSTRNESINGYMVSGSMTAEVANGKKKNDSMSFSEDRLKLCGIEGIAEIEFSFHIYDSKSWDTYFDTKLIKLRTNIADTYQQNYDHQGTTIYDKNGIKIIVLGLNESGWLGPEMYMYIENNTKRNISIYTENVSVNGFMISDFFSSGVLAGKKNIDELTIYTSDLEENDIKKIEEVEFSLRVRDSDSYDTIINTDPLKVEFD